MQCPCGGETTDKKVIRNKELAGTYIQCTACGRITWKYRTQELIEELARERNGRS